LWRKRKGVKQKRKAFLGFGKLLVTMKSIWRGKYEGPLIQTKGCAFAGRGKIID